MLSAEQIAALCEASSAKVEGARRALRGLTSGLVAFSGGADSAFVLKLAADELGDAAVALTAISPAVPAQEQDEARAFAEALGVRHIAVDSRELERPGYVQNDPNRCYHCKSELYEICDAKRRELGLEAVLDGYNADDMHDHRPGQRAALERQVVSILAANRLTKDEVRAWSHRLGLPTWNKPAMPCLASRIPYGTAVTRDRLIQLGTAESDLRALGLRIFRVRYHDSIARLEVASEEQEKFHSPEFRARVNAALRARGFKFVVLDLEPFRSGRLNEAAGVVPEANVPRR